MSSQPGKDTIYIDVDDEITAIIDKVRSSNERIVALVLPKRATVFQSIVNMKLLKRTADEAKKHLVLITSEAGLLPLAGNVGIYVAKTLQSRPEIPTAPGGSAHAEDESEEAVDMAEAAEEKDEAKLDPARSVGSFSGGAQAGAGMADLEDDVPIDFDNDEPLPASAAAKKSKKSKKGRKFSIPDFNKFRTWIVLGGAALVALIIMWYVGFVAMPRATITVKTDSTAVAATFDVKLDTDADEVNVDGGVIPAKLQQVQKTAAQQVEATGQKDKGTKATGEVTIKNCGGNEIAIPAGTAISANGLTFITQSRLDLDDGKFGNVCKPAGEHIGSVDVVAQQAGAQYNLEPRSDYKVAGQDAGLVTANGSAMSGGTSQIVKIVSQADIDTASQKISAADNTAVKTELQQALESQGLFVIAETFSAGKPEVTASAKVGDEVATVTITQKTTFSLVGTQQGDLKKLVENAVSDQIDPTKQSILDYGITEAVFKMQSQQGSRTLVSFDGTAIAGSDLNLSEIKKQVAGKKANSAKEIIGAYPGVTDVKVNYSPFWVKSIPKKESKITITVEKPTINNAKQQ